jgi:hypothetical protein
MILHVFLRIGLSHEARFSCEMQGCDAICPNLEIRHREEMVMVPPNTHKKQR